MNTGYTVFALVVGSNDFPLDMLRYDSCYPFNEEDASNLDSDVYERRAIVVARDDGRPFEPERWHSFCWKVVGQYRNFTEAEQAQKDWRATHGNV